MAEDIIPHDHEGEGRERDGISGHAGAEGVTSGAAETRLNEYDLQVHELYRDETLIGRGRRRLKSKQEKIYRREGLVFPYLARSLSLKVHELDHYFRFNGLPADVIIFALLMRAYYHQLSARRLDFELERARREGLIPEIPTPNTVLYHQRQIDLSRVLELLTGIAALPFRNYDWAFAVDATRNYTTAYLKDENGKVEVRDGRKRYKWVKLHLMSGLNSLSVVAARATRWPVREIRYLKPLVLDAVSQGFNVRSVAADRGYVSKDNHRLLHEIGAEAFITFMKHNRKSKKGADPEWDEDLERFRGMSKVDLALYEERIKIEAVNWMVKARFGRAVRGDTEEAQLNGALLKAVSHNLTRLNQYELSVNNLYDPTKS